jgi:adenine deaminase
MDSKIMDLAFINLVVICILVLTGLGILNVVKGRFFN